MYIPSDEREEKIEGKSIGVGPPFTNIAHECVTELSVPSLLLSVIFNFKIGDLSDCSKKLYRDPN